MSLLIVASETSSPLCTDVPIPTDGQPQWWKCQKCDLRRRAGDYVHERCVEDGPPHLTHRVEPDGPFPFTVGVWEELERNDRYCTLHDTLWNYCPHDDCEPVSGAIVELVEVVGPSHFPYLGMHHSRCSDEHLCHPDAAPDCWHTPTGAVTPIDPIPCERPVLCGCGCDKPVDQAKRESRSKPGMFNLEQCDEMVERSAYRPSVWAAPEDIAAKLMEVTA